MLNKKLSPSSFRTGRGVVSAAQAFCTELGAVVRTSPPRSLKLRRQCLERREGSLGERQSSEGGSSRRCSAWGSTERPRDELKGMARPV